MRVLHVYKTYLPESIGGVENVIHEIVKGTLNQGIHSEVFTLTKLNVPMEQFYDGYKIHKCRIMFEVGSTPFSFFAIFRFRKLVRSFDLIHYHFPYPFADMLHLINGMGKPYIVTYHSDIIKQKMLLKLYTPLKRYFLEGAKQVIATSPNYLKSSPVLPSIEGKVTIIPIGITNSSYPSASESRRLFWSSKFPDRFFLFVGVLRYYKGLHILLEAATRFKYPVLIVGSGPIENELRRESVERGVTNIHFLGHIDEEDKLALLELCFSIVFPSHLRSEAFGVSLLEGAMYGKPLISSEIGTGTSFINIDHETGLVVPPSNPIALANAMDTLWHDEDLAMKFGLNARKRYLELFTGEKMSKAYVVAYRRALGLPIQN